MKRVWTARSLAAVLGGSLLYFLITVLVMMCGSFSPLFWFFLPPITAAASGWLYLYLAARTPRFGVPVLMNLVVLLLFLAAVMAGRKTQNKGENDPHIITSTVIRK